jgi:glycosyltransferase involved in cell wall biosynthesis
METRDISEPQPPLDRFSFTYSIVVPVFNSARHVSETISEIVSEMERLELSYELILVNDGSSDDSWDVLAEQTRKRPHLVAVNLLRNYGQHSANLAGFREATGDFVITMDDDLQNPPDQIGILIDEAMKGNDVVFGAFQQKRAGWHRRLGSALITRINRQIFGQPPDLVVSNFRILRRDVVDRISASHTAFPYITGQALMYSSRRSHVAVRHDRANVDKSRYSLRRLFRLVFTILFSYSVFPLRLAAGLGFGIATLSFLLGAAYLIRGLVADVEVQGWTTLVVLVAAFNGVIIALLSMLGEYVVRTLNVVSADETFHIVNKVRSCDDTS